MFVSYQHDGDQGFYDDFVKLFSTTYDVISDNSLDRAVDSDDAEYVMRRIRENHITGSSSTVVLVGEHTWGRKYVDWEIDATLQKQRSHPGRTIPRAIICQGAHISLRTALPCANSTRCNGAVTWGYRARACWAASASCLTSI